MVGAAAAAVSSLHGLGWLQLWAFTPFLILHDAIERRQAYLLFHPISALLRS